VTALDDVPLGRVRDYLDEAVRLTDGGIALVEGDAGAVVDLLVDAGERDLGLARAIEPHVDAVSILTQAAAVGFGSGAPRGSAYGVFASEAPGGVLRATASGDGWTLDGTKQWCSLAGTLDRALVTATTDGGDRMLFDVALRGPGVEVLDAGWVARGLVEIPSGPVAFDAVAATPVGPAGWYLSRPGFHWGGIAVAACWIGGAVGLARDLLSALTPQSREFQLAHLGAVDTTISTALLVLADAADRIDDGSAEGEAGRVLAYRVRAVAAAAADAVVRRVGRALGPGPLATDGPHAKRVADLELYVRQHHAERDEAALGAAVLSDGDRPW
jgi:alkylation response protein AidB-like acyl-CoA dehydrogenase